ncbi:MAG: 1-acyl-sn-glycerol-3-phosphate acyltransferase [Dysgonamonadaceae bacterium]|jgi:1-acyl-sn-glycerol-3-phosphate acyltransferase|nr:1-acyl-sn-glycerol-3-phosphate acyltransferase [Dysgonamonadaceae bacterium]
MKRFFLLYQLFIWFPLFSIVTILTALTVTVGCSLGGERFFSYYPGAWWSKIVCIITLCPVKVTGREKLDKKQSYVFVSNHQGAFDIFLIYGYLGQPIKWVMKQSLRKIPFVGMACEKAGFIFVDSSSPKAAAQTIHDAEERLKNGASIAIFPEGSRSKTGKINAFKKGAYQMALDLKLPVVPVTINGTYEVMPVHSYWVYPHKLELIIHDPIPTTDLRSENLREAALNIRRILDESKTKIESGLWEKYQTSC